MQQMAALWAALCLYVCPHDENLPTNDDDCEQDEQGAPPLFVWVGAVVRVARSIADASEQPPVCRFRASTIWPFLWPAARHVVRDGQQLFRSPVGSASNLPTVP